MKTKLASLALTSKQLDSSRNAQLFYLNDENDGLNLAKLLDNHQEIKVKDELQAQLIELIKLRYPKEKHSDAETQVLIDQHLNGLSEEKYGVWAYYEWNNTLVHILDRDEFYEVKTNRNHHKITREESELLSQQIVGVVGLSVGRTIAITMTMEHSYGEIRIADFDVLDLSNYNRIRAGINDLGIKKTISVAREIAEIDPYVKVTCFNDGLTDDNIDAFFTEGGTLNALIDECDGLDIKILLREKAKALQIPVIMDMNDRGTMDIERFDLEPDRPLLHGFIGHLDSSKLKGLTNEEKLPYIMPMLGETTISTKLKASMLEIEQTLTTWPQLAADVTLGGAVAANVYRRIILDEFHDSGRYFVDMDDLIRNKTQEEFKPFVQEKINHQGELKQEDLEQIIKNGNFSIDEAQLELNDPTLQKLLTSATLAPSTANVQSWKWLYSNRNLFLIHDAVVAESFGDYNDLGSLISYGAAIENLIQEAQNLDLSTSVEYPNSDSEGLKVVACIKFYKNNIGKEPLLEENLSSYIESRHTNRKRNEFTPLTQDIKNALITTAKSIPGVELKLFTDRELVAQASNLIGVADKLRFFDEGGHHDFFVKEARWTKEESELTADGIDLRTVELSPAELTGMKLARDYDVVKQLKKWKGGGAFEKMAHEAFSQCSGLGLFCITEKTQTSAIDVGRSMERTWLKSTQLDINVQPWMSIIFHFNRLINGNGEGMDKDYIEETKKLRNEFEQLLGLESELKELFLVRFFHADKSEVKSIRKPLSSVFFQDQTLNF